MLIITTSPLTCLPEQARQLPDHFLHATFFANPAFTSMPILVSPIMSATSVTMGRLVEFTRLAGPVRFDYKTAWVVRPKTAARGCYPKVAKPAVALPSRAANRFSSFFWLVASFVVHTLLLGAGRFLPPNCSFVMNAV